MALIAILGVPVALVRPAVQPAPEAARRVRRIHGLWRPGLEVRGAAGTVANPPKNAGDNRRFNGWVPDGPASYSCWDTPARGATTAAADSGGSRYAAIFFEQVPGDGAIPSNAEDGIRTTQTPPGFDPRMVLGIGIGGEDLNGRDRPRGALARGAPWEGGRWMLQDPGRGGPCSRAMPTSRRPCSYWCGEVSADDLETMAAAGSHRPRGASIRFLDGSVRFVRGTVRYRTWRANGTRDGGVVSRDAP